MSIDKLLYVILLTIFLDLEAQAQIAQTGEWAEAIARAKVANQTNVVRLLTDSKFRNATWIFEEQPTNISYQGQPINKVFVNTATAGSNNVSIDELLTLKQVLTGDEPAIITYELPMSHYVLTNINHAELSLLMDPSEEFESQPTLKSCEQAANGDCLLRWNTVIERPGQHALQASLILLGPITKCGTVEINGPVKPYFSSNLFRFPMGGAIYNDGGASFDAELPESNGLFSIEIKAPSGELVKTLRGRTSDGTIQVNWDLTDENGRKYTNDSFVDFVTVQLPDSGRSQTLKQWGKKPTACKPRN